MANTTTSVGSAVVSGGKMEVMMNTVSHPALNQYEGKRVYLAYDDATLVLYVYERQGNQGLICTLNEW